MVSVKKSLPLTVVINLFGFTLSETKMFLGILKQTKTHSETHLNLKFAMSNRASKFRWNHRYISLDGRRKDVCDKTTVDN